MFFKGELSPSACPALLNAIRATSNFCRRPNTVLVVVEDSHTYVTNNLSDGEEDPVTDKSECISRFNNNYLWRAEGYSLTVQRLAFIINARAFSKRLLAAGTASHVKLKLEESITTEHLLQCEVVGQSFTTYAVDLILPPRQVPTFRIPLIELTAIQIEMHGMDVKSGVLSSASTMPETRTEVTFTISDPESIRLARTSPQTPIAGCLRFKTGRASTPAQYSDLSNTHQCAGVSTEAYTLAVARSPPSTLQWRAIVHSKDLHAAVRVLSDRMSNTMAYLIDQELLILTGLTQFGPSVELYVVLPALISL